MFIEDYLFVLVVYLIIDLTWVSLVSVNQFSKIVKKIQGSDMEVRLMGNVITYLLLSIGIYYFAVLPAINDNDNGNDNVTESLIRAFLFGLIVYGVFNGVNYAIFKDYPVCEAILDSLWGGTVSMIVTYIALNYIK